MPLNEHRFNGSRLLKHFIRVSSGLVDTLEPLYPLCCRNRQEVKTQCFTLKWLLPARTPSHKAFSMEIWLAPFFWLNNTLRPCFWVTFGAEAWSRINIRGVSEQRDTQDLAAEEQIRTKAMDVLRLVLLLLCVLHLTCKYCLLYSSVAVTLIQKHVLTGLTSVFSNILNNPLLCGWHKC